MVCLMDVPQPVYLKEGAEGLRIECRGRKFTGHPPKLKKEFEEDLIAEVHMERYNTKRIKLKLDGLSPAAYRLNAA